MILHLTPSERALYDKLPAAIKKAWAGKVIEETGNVFESRVELDRRLAKYSADPALAPYLERANLRLKKGDKLPNILADMPPDVLRVFFEAIGIGGLSAFIEFALVNPAIDESGLRGVAELSAMRHQKLSSAITS